MIKSVNGIFPGELYPDETVAGCIEIFKNVWPDPKNTIDALENEAISPYSGMNWVRAITIDKGLDQEVRTNYHMGITYAAENYNNLVAQNIHNQTYLILLASTLPYAKKYGIDSLHYEPYTALKYSGGQYYKAHSDGDTSTGRSISAIIYLNDDYDGGEIEFVNYGIKIKPEAGTLLLFPSNYAYKHIAHPVTDGKKYAIVTWIMDRYVEKQF